ncbi:coagulation factor VII [Hypomesus transpacificus]|uniref:coagulation factor VII n=1 Tax=Hypomesus transpacificus TaxID=137520 RepID=UPI001F078306|nr:coagulation factor VII [Hypomesus transpacificus]
MESLTHSLAVKLTCMVLLSLCTVADSGLPRAAAVFRSRQEASGVLAHPRLRRANSILEELKLGDLERECLEETCSYEEAREIFTRPEQLDKFWKIYSDVDDCESGPCLNGAPCVDQVNAYICLCPLGFEGRNCDRAKRTSYGCLYKNGGCQHFCREFPDLTHTCYCAPGYKLAKDNSSCQPQVSFPCGRPVNEFQPRVVKGEECPKGQCPWQALLEYRKEYKCGAIVLAPQWILTAAHCVWRMDATHIQVIAGKHNRSMKENTEQVRQVARLIIHPQYNHTTTDVDLALLKLRKPLRPGPFVVPVCLPALDGSFERTLATVRTSVVSGWGRLAQSGPFSTLLQRLEVPRVPLQECRAHSGLNVTRNMLCAGFREGGRDACQGDSGGPLVTHYKHTWFLTGVVSWGKGCAGEDFYGIYTRVANFLGWIDRTMSTG